MPTRTDAILENLPFSFRPDTQRSALRAMAGSVGSELHGGEVSLARILRSHWVDTADENAKSIDDLARIGSLWGLAPMRDNDGLVLESVEQFREHLKRYVRTLLEGTVTVRGILLLASDILGVTVAIDDESFDAWWNREAQILVSSVPRGEDAAFLVFGIPFIEPHGADSQPARVTGSINLATGIELGERSVLRLQVDEHGPFDIELQGAEPRVTLDEIIDAINQPFPAPVARQEGGHLILESIALGPDGRIEIEDQDEDAAPLILGVPAMIYTGEDASAAQFTATVDLSAGIDLREHRYLRLVVDGVELAEIDCAAEDAEFTLLDHIRDNINAAFGAEVASHDGRLLSLASSIAGAGSSLFLQEPAAQNCGPAILGVSRAFFLGSDAKPAVATGAADLSQTVDLSERSQVRVKIDAAPPVTVNCAGADPARTTVQEIVLLLNAALGAGTATSDGRRITVISNTAGRTGQIVFEPANENDALLDIFGFETRVFEGSAALPATFTGLADLSGKINLIAQHLIGLSLDGGPVREIDLRSHAADIANVTPPEVVDAINDVFPELAFSDGQHILLTSQTTGAASTISIVPLEIEQRRRFTSRAMILEEASQIILGFTARRTVGDAATIARVVGLQDLRFGVDLREDRWLVVSIDGGPSVTVDCGGPRPRATTVVEAAGNLKAALGDEQVAHDGEHLLLISPSAGAGSSVVFHPVTVLDAAPELLGEDAYGDWRGTDATRVVFIGTKDLSKGVELEPDARVSISLDGAPPVEIPLNASSIVARKTLGELSAAINFGLNATVASSDGRFLVISSQLSGNQSMLEFAPASGTDAAGAIFGIDPPRLYHGADATRAETRGKKHSGPVNLGVARYLRVAVNGAEAKVIDCAAASADPQAAELADIASAINAAINGVAEEVDGRLVLHSNTRGSASRLALEPHVAGDARGILFGAIPAETRGLAPQPARITGDVSLLKPVDLSRNRILRIAVDNGRPLELDIAGDTPAKTSYLEILESINRSLPGVASLSAEGKLILTSPTAGEEGAVEVLARRHLELIEYPPESRSSDIGAVSHGQQFSLHNGGAARTFVKITLESERGVVDPALVNQTLGLVIAIGTVVRAGDRLVVYQHETAGVRARIESPIAPPVEVDASDIMIERLEGAPVKESPLELPRGTTDWMYLECTGARFNEARFDEDRFAGLPCVSLGIFDVSRLDGTYDEEASIFWPPPPPPGPSARLSFEWVEYRHGAFELNLPAELPPVFGGRFNEARFGLGNKTEKFEGIVFEPEEDDNYIVKVLNASSTLVEASEKFTNVPIGFVGNNVPFRPPRSLSLGAADAPARIYLLEEGLPGVLELKARENGAWGNEIAVSFRPDGPARYQLELYFPGDRFEGARSVVLGGTTPEQPPASDLPPCAKKPLPFASLPSTGVLDGKAAGVRARVTRERLEITEF